jgi:RNA polymerase sigma-70 factor (ECF subfamily)
VQPWTRKGRPIPHDPRPERPLEYERLSEPILIRRAKDGDRRALEVLCRRHQPRVERLARHLLRDPEDARDATQDALTKVCARISQFRGDAQLATWVHRITVNACRDVAQRRQVHEELVDDMRAAPERPDTLAMRDELSAALAEIPSKQAEVVVLKDALDLSFEEVAALADVPVGTAKCYAHRARERLRARLEGAA